jgi:hypothetical protein
VNASAEPREQASISCSSVAVEVAAGAGVVATALSGVGSMAIRFVASAIRTDAVGVSCVAPI